MPESSPVLPLGQASRLPSTGWRPSARSSPARRATPPRPRRRWLARVDPAAGTVESVDASHGLQSSEFNWGAHYQSRTGELFFGGVNGFNAFHPGRIERNTAVPAVVVTELTKLDRPLDLGRPIFDVDEIELSYRDDVVSFEFAALDFAAPARNRYRYRLEGVHEEWLDLGHRRRLTFTDLDPGRYLLRIRGSNNDGVWNEEGEPVTVS